MLRFPDDVGLTSSCDFVPQLVEVASRRPTLNQLNLDAVAAARVLGAEIWLSPPETTAILPPVLDEESIRWKARTI